MKKTIKTIIVFALFISSHAMAANIAFNTKATASISPSCRVKVDNMSFGNVSMQSISGNGDIFATSQMSVLCTKDTSFTVKSDNGINAGSQSGTWVLGANYICQNNYFGGVWNTDGAQSTCQNYVFPRNGSQVNSIPVLNNSNPALGDYYFRFVRTDGSTIAAGELPIPGEARIKSGTNAIPYSLSTTSNMSQVINPTSTVSFTYNQNNGDWQNYPLYAKSNVQSASPGVYTDTNTLIISF